MVNVKKEGWVIDLFSEEEGWGEDEARYVEGLGWFIFQVEDNAGSVTIVITKEKLEAFPFGDEEWKLVNESDDTIGICKNVFYGSFGQSDTGEGCLMTKLEGDTYKNKRKFESWDEGERVLEDYLNTLIK